MTAEASAANRSEGRGRTLLMLAYYFPPCNCWPTASERSLGFAMGLSELGWRPVIVTRSLRAGTCRCEADSRQPDPYRGFPGDAVHALTLRPLSRRTGPRPDAGSMGRIRSRASIYRRSLADASHLETSNDWVQRAIEEGEAIAADRSIDAVWTTTGPMSSVAIGNHFKRTHGIPWIADIRDSFRRRFFRPGLDVSIRRRVRYRKALLAVRPLDLANARVYVSEGEAESDDGLFSSPPHVIESGFDLRTWQRLHADPPPARSDERLQVLFAGRVYPERTGYDTFFEGVRLFRDRQSSDPSVAVTYLGSNPEQIIRSAERSGVADVVTLGGVVTLERSRRAMMEADLLLLVTASGGSGMPGSKLYEYAAAGPPILAVPGDDDFVAGFLRNADIGTCASTNSEVAAVLERIRSRELARGSWAERSERLAEYAWERRAWHLSRLLDQIQETQREAQPA